MKDTEYRIVYLEEASAEGEQTSYKAVALAYDMETGEARGLNESEAPADFENYIEEVRDDMDSLGQVLIEDILKSGSDDTSDYMNTLAVLREQPVDLLANILATIMLDCAQSAEEDVVSQAEQIRE